MINKKNILVIDDSALMRRVLCDIIESDERFIVADKAVDGLEGLEFLTKKTYDAVVLDVNMPKMTGLELLKELKKRKISAKILMASTDTREGARITIECLELGASDFIHKPDIASNAREENFKKQFLDTLSAVVQSRTVVITEKKTIESEKMTSKIISNVKKHEKLIQDNQIVAIASSTGGPKALQAVIPKLPGMLKAPVLIVQHMPVGFTKSLADRLDTLSQLHVKEAEEGEMITSGTVYVARGGLHMNVTCVNGRHQIHYSDEPSREGVKPCANYMYESLKNSSYSQALCVVMTGMGADGTKGIVDLKENKKIHVIAQEESTCAVYGMPKSIVKNNLQDQIVPLEQIAQEIIMNVGVK